MEGIGFAEAAWAPRRPPRGRKARAGIPSEGGKAEEAEGTLDAAPRQGAPLPALHRLNRTEYANAIRDLFGANLTSQNPVDSAAAPTALKVVWTGKLPGTFGDQTVTVRAFYNGAVAGLQDLTQNRNVNFLASANPGDTNTVNLQSDIAFSSVFQQSTEFLTPKLDDVRFGVLNRAAPRLTLPQTSGTQALDAFTTDGTLNIPANPFLPNAAALNEHFRGRTVEQVRQDLIAQLSEMREILNQGMVDTISVAQQVFDHVYCL
mgnify:CR=1 FL=1